MKPSAKLFRTHVRTRSASRHSDLRNARHTPPKLRRQTEIDELNVFQFLKVQRPVGVSGKIKHNVGRFDIAVNDLLLMRIVESLRDRHQNFRDPLQRQFLLAAQKKFQTDALQKFHHEIRTKIIMLMHSVNRANVRVLKRMDRLKRLANAFHFRIKILNITRHELDGNVTFPVQVTSFPDLPQTAASDFFFKPPTVKFRTGSIYGRPIFLILRPNGRSRRFTLEEFFGHW